MASIGVFTIASKNYLAYVRVLMESVARVHPEYQLFLCLADQVDGYFDSENESYTIIETERLGIPCFNDLTLRYDIMEFNTAVKPFMFRWLFDNTDLDAVIYLDPDIQIFSRFLNLESLLNDNTSIVLTPHITQSLADDKSPSDYNMLQAGVFNLGFIAARRCVETLEFMRWWGERLQTQCVNDLQSNLFVDQKWCDLAPCLLENLKVLRDVGYNVAYWNMAQRKITQTESHQWLVNGLPLVFFHFSGINPLDKKIVSKHQNRFTWADVADIQPLFEDYNDALMKADWKNTCSFPYVYDSLPEGIHLHRVIRLQYRSEYQNSVKFEMKDVSQYLDYACNQPSPDLPEDDDVYISKLMHLIYRLRIDLHTVFSMDTPVGRKQFASWFQEAGPREYGLPDKFTLQHLIRLEKDQYLQKNYWSTFAYQSMKSLEPTFIKLSKSLPDGLRNSLKRQWGKLRSQTLSGF